MPDSFLYQDNAGGGTLWCLAGDWVIANADQINAEIRRFRKSVGKVNKDIVFDAKDLGQVDTAGGVLIQELLGSKADLSQLKRLNTDRKDFLKFILELPDKSRDAPQSYPTHKHFIERVGRKTFRALRLMRGVLIFSGRTFAVFVDALFAPRRFRFASIVRHIEATFLRAAPIVALLSFLIAIVLAYQGATQLKQFGAEIFTVDLTIISIMREMAVLLTAILVAGRSGSAFAAEIAVMKMREEIDALRTLGMDPFEVLVLPRVIALTIALPALTLIADLVGIAGGALMSVALIDIPLSQYFVRVHDVMTLQMFFVGMVKAPVFALIIAMVGTYHGMNATGTAENVGRVTTVSVVQSIFLVILADALFSIVFSKLGI